MDPQMKLMMEMMSQPVFYAEKGTVLWLNRRAVNLVFENQSLDIVLGEAGNLYLLWNRQGPAEMELDIFGLQYLARVSVLGEGELFVLEKREQNAREKGNALLQTSIHLRQILQEMLSSTMAIQEQIGEQKELIPETQILNRSVYRLIRLCNQLSDGGNLLHRNGVSFFELTNIREFLDQFARETGELLEESGWKLDYIPCEKTIKGRMDRSLIQKALYSLLTYGIQHSSPGRAVKLGAWEDETQICFAVSYGASATVGSSFWEDLGSLGEFSRADGIGTDIVRLIAELHGGTVMTTSSGEDERKIIFTVRKRNYSYTLRCPMVVTEAEQNFHTGLVELSEILDAKLYHPDRV